MTLVATEDEFADSPFVSNDPLYDFWSDAHCLAAEQLGFVVNSSLPLTLFTGQSGVGKSIVLRSVVEELSKAHLLGQLADLSALQSKPCAAVLSAFGAEVPQDEGDISLSVFKNSFLAARKHYPAPTLFVDRAHDIEQHELATLLEIAGIAKTADDALFKIVLVGDVGLPDRLSASFSALIGPAVRLENMSDEDSADYIRHRLACAEYKSVLFSDDALEIIVKYAKGNASVINLICDAALSQFYGDKQDRIEAATVRKCFARAAESLRRRRALAV